MASLNDIETRIQNIIDIIEVRVISTITGVLPITFRADGSALINYRIYGTADGAGVQTENKFDYVPYFASMTTYNRYFSYANIQLSPNTTYTLSTNFHSGTSGSLVQSRETPFIACNAVDSPSTLTGGFGDDGSVSVTTTGDGIIRLYVRTSRGDNPEELCDVPALSDFENGKWVMIVEGSTPPETYIPYGYKLPLTLTSGTESKEADIFIGDSKLLTNDYLDYETGKIVRNGTLQDPPKQFPKIDTYIGINTLDSVETLGEVTIKGKIKEVI